MINKVESAARSLTFLPPGRHGAQVNVGHALARDVPGYPRVMPGGDPTAQVVEVYLALLGCAHLVAFWQVIRLVQNCPRQKPSLGGISSASRDETPSRMESRRS